MSEAAPHQLVIDSTHSFFMALRSHDAATLVAVFRSVAKNPEAALAFGKYEGRDVVDELIFQSQQREGITLQQLILGTLAAFRDPRIPERMMKALSVATDSQIIQIAIDRLSWEPTESYVDFVRPLLMQENSRIHTFGAADLLADYSGLKIRERVRVTVANTVGADLGPELDAQSLEAWLSELNGWFAPQSRAVLEARGGDVFEQLVGTFDRFSSPNKVWLIGLGMATSPVDTIPLLRKAIHDVDGEVVIAALTGIEQLGSAGSLFSSALTPLLAHDLFDVRFMAIRAGAKSGDWRSILAREDRPEIIALILVRIAETEGAGSFDVILPHLDDGDHRFRSAAVQALVAVGQEAIKPLRERAGDSDVGKRVAATQALSLLGDYDWLEDNLLTS